MYTPREKRGGGGGGVVTPPLLPIQTSTVRVTLVCYGLLLEYFIPKPISPHLVVHVSVSRGLAALIVLFDQRQYIKVKENKTRIQKGEFCR